MSVKKTLVAYATASGVTKEYAETIASVLRNDFQHTVDLLDVKKNPKPDTSSYDNIIIGTGVRAQNVYKNGTAFLKNDFGDKKIAVYLSSNEAGAEKSYPNAEKKYMNPIKENNPHLNLVDITGFGGRIKALGISVVDLVDHDKAKGWAKTLGPKLE